jgi:hypothetical protein
MATKGVPGLPVAIIAAGGILAWSGIYNQSLTSALGSILKGKAPTPGAQVVTSVTPVTPGTGEANPNAFGDAVISGGGSEAANKALGEAMAAAYGWTGVEWEYLESGWEEESGWSTTAANVPSDPYNHAYGIPQANPGSKMASAGSNWQTSAATQIKWGLGYIKATYGSPTSVPNWSANGPTAGYVGY